MRRYDDQRSPGPGAGRCGGAGRAAVSRRSDGEMLLDEEIEESSQKRGRENGDEGQFCQGFF